MSTNIITTEYTLYTGLVTPQRQEKCQKYFQILIKQFCQFLNFNPLTTVQQRIKVTQQKLKKIWDIMSEETVRSVESSGGHISFLNLKTNNSYFP
jgi:hypothetical protein